MYEVKDNGEINIQLTNEVITIYSYIADNVCTYRLFFDNKNPISGKYTKGSGLLIRQLFFKPLRVITNTQSTSGIVVIDVEEF